MASRIKETAEELYGEGARPNAIILTHGHFDHAGAVKTLAEEWDAPVYAHRLEMPYLTGRSAYPPPDPSVSGAMARLSWLYPKQPIDLVSRIQTLPDDNSVPGMMGWHWIHTPGHAPGHVSLFRDEDRTLIAGDAFVTTKQESLLAVLTQQTEVHEPPKYFTPDWDAARRSVQKLAALSANVAATGHGLPMRGEEMRQQLDRLARDFDRLAVPHGGRYDKHPAITDERGVISVPPPPLASQLSKLIAIAGVAALGGALLIRANRKGS